MGNGICFKPAPKRSSRNFMHYEISINSHKFHFHMVVWMEFPRKIESKFFRKPIQLTCVCVKNSSYHKLSPGCDKCTVIALGQKIWNCNWVGANGDVYWIMSTGYCLFSKRFATIIRKYFHSLTAINVYLWQNSLYFWLKLFYFFYKAAILYWIC